MALPTFGGYQLDETLGQSALGTTYAGQWRNAPIVVKVLEIGATVSETEQRHTQAEFRRRCEAISALYHPGIVALRDYGQALPYLYAVSGFQAGGSLRDPEGRRLFTAPLDLDQARNYAQQLGEALGEAHRRDVAHGNLKPANIFILEALNTGPLRLAIGDFALVSENLHLTVRPPGQQRLWRYLAPEIPGHAPTVAGDEFALAALCYEWLAGRPAFENVLPGERRPLVPITEARVSLSFWPALDGVFARALAPQPEQRYPTVADFIAALDAVAEPTRTDRAAISDMPTRASDPNDTRPSKEMPAIVTDVLTLPLGDEPPASQASPSAFLLDSPIGPKPPTADLRRMQLNESLSGLGDESSVGRQRRGRKATPGPLPVVRGPTTREQELMAPAAPRQLRRRRPSSRRPPPPVAPASLPAEALGLPLDVPIARRSALTQLGRLALGGALAVGGTVVVAEGVIHLVGGLFAAKSAHVALGPPIVVGSHATAIQALEWSPDSTRLASGAQGDGTILFWQPTRPGSPASQLVTSASKSGITDLSWARDSHYLLVSAGGTNTQIWNVGQQQVIQHVPYQAVQARWHPTLNIASLSLAPSTGKTTTTAQSLLIWDIANAQLLTTLNGHTAAITTYAWWPGATTLLLASGDAAGNAFVWEGASAATIGSGIQLNTQANTAINGLGWSFTKEQLALSSQSGTVRIFDAHHQASIATLLDGADTVTALAGQQHTDLVAIAFASGSIQIWQSVTNQRIATLPGLAQGVIKLAWSSDLHWLAAGMNDGRILLWNTAALYSPA